MFTVHGHVWTDLCMYMYNVYVNVIIVIHVDNEYHSLEPLPVNFLCVSLTRAHSQKVIVVSLCVCL